MILTLVRCIDSHFRSKLEESPGNNWDLPVSGLRSKFNVV